MSAALNRSGDTDGPTATARCREIPLDEGEAPEWIQLLPLGPEIVGRDGRAWVMHAPDTVAANSEIPMVVDVEHATALRAPMGDPAPAAGWVEELRVVREGDEDVGEPGIWARMAWTQSGAEMVKSKEYRFISPEFLFEPRAARS